MKKILQTFLSLFAILGMLVFSLWGLEHSDFFTVKQIDLLVNDSPDSPYYLREWVGELQKNILSNYRSASLWKLDLEEVVTRIQKQSWIENVAVSRRFPSRLQISIVPKKIECLLYSRAGVLYPVVNNGDLLNSVPAQAAPDVPILVGELMEKNLELRKRSVQILGEIPEEGSFSRKAISDLHFHPKEGFWVRLVNSKIHVNLGEEGIRLKSRRVTEVLDYISAHNFQARVIDANLSKKVLVRLRKDP